MFTTVHKIISYSTSVMSTEQIIKAISNVAKEIMQSLLSLDCVGIRFIEWFITIRLLSVY
jgi:hypothetical protein